MPDLQKVQFLCFLGVLGALMRPLVPEVCSMDGWMRPGQAYMRHRRRCGGGLKAAPHKPPKEHLLDMSETLEALTRLKTPTGSADK